MINLLLAGTLKPIPDFVKRIANANLQHGQQMSGFRIWPTARPVVALEQSESLKLAFRIRPEGADAGGLRLAPGTSDQFKLRREANGNGYWLDVEIGPLSRGGTHNQTIGIETGGPVTGNLSIALTINVHSENIIPTPAALDFGELSLAELKGGSYRAGRVGLRKLVGSFSIKSLSATLPFLKFETQPIVEGSNYLIKVGFIPDKLPRAGSYSGVIRVETNDSRNPHVEIPVKLIVVAR